MGSTERNIAPVAPPLSSFHSAGMADYLISPQPKDPRLTERVAGVDQAGKPVETSVTVERPLRLVGADPNRIYKAKELKELKATAKRSEEAPPIIKKIHKKGTEADPLRGLFATTIDGRPTIVEYEPDTDLRDTEQIPLLEEGGIETFLEREVLPYAPDAWFKEESVKIGYEISFTRYFYKPQPMRSLEEIRADILALEKETEGLLGEIIGEVAK